MGNCQATDSAMVVMHHPGGRAERMYWPISVSKVMRSNPGHYVALVTFCQLEAGRNENNSVHVKILRPTDTLLIGQVYRLVTSQEVMNDLWEKKYWRMKKKESDSEKQQQRISRSLECLKEESKRSSEWEKSIKEAKQERHQPKTTQCIMRSKRQWRPSLQSISEVGS
ncbi:uncharacterized protein LOC131258273 [Magnolia sinica]|uniref:uncharacterized protein LOC131258273 n=1 Tax=Magnolia sinica TaxID=86752 RepID=UPI0026590D97|nr:uncharacterized protein LOC131258273 [Magnolia sinica]